jgi:hypothetical protein
LQESFLNGGNAGGAAEQCVERGKFAELLVAEESEFFVGVALRSFLYGGETVFDEASLGVALVDERAGDEGSDGHEEEDEECD